MFAKCIEQVRAAHALAFAMDSGIAPHTADLRALGIRRWTRTMPKGGSGR